MSVSKSALAGLTATLPMTITMSIMKNIPYPQAKALPPEKVADGVAKKLGFEQNMDTSDKKAFTWVSHFGFGAGAGALYSVITPNPDQNPVVKGMLFGLGVWAVSYAGWIPAAGIMKFPTEEPKRYVALQVLSHLVWGGCMGALAATRTLSRPLGPSRDDGQRFAKRCPDRPITEIKWTPRVR